MTRSGTGPPTGRPTPPPSGTGAAPACGIYERLIAEELGEEETGAFLVWGDPSLYDSTLGILEEVLERDAVAFEYDVVPGISSVSALVARHRTGLNRIARPVQITTGRRLAEGFPAGVDDVVVMLDAQQTFRQYAREDVDIYWGAYIGTPDEILVSGPLAEAAPRIERLRAEARERKGWIMDTYLLRPAPSRLTRPGGYSCGCRTVLRWCPPPAAIVRTWSPCVPY